ncbi:MAG: tetratricopeptide repeat protein [Myxococcota bacterium]
MSVQRYECPRCQSVFVPAEAVSEGAFARCPSCGGVAVPASKPPGPSRERLLHNEGDGSSITGASDPPERSAPDFTAPPPAPPPATMWPQDATMPTSSGLFAALLSGSPDLELSGPALSAPPPSTPPPAATEEAPPESAPEAPGGGLFASLISGTPDLVPSAAPRAKVGGGAAELGIHDEERSGDDPDRTTTYGTGDEATHAATSELTLPPNSQEFLLPPVTGTAELISTYHGEPTMDGELPRPPPSAAPTGEAPAPEESPYLDKETFNDDEFASLLGGSFNTAPVPEETVRAPVVDGWVVNAPGKPPPLKKPVEAPAPPPAKPKTDNAASLLAGLAPIPSVASLGPAPKLGSGITPLRVAAVLVSALLLGTLSGVGLAPPPPTPASTGPEGARVRLAEARRLLASGQDKEAVQVLHAALALDDKLAEAMRDLGVAYARQEKYEEAARAYEAYLEMSPKAPDAIEMRTSIERYKKGGPR